MHAGHRVRAEDDFQFGSLCGSPHYIMVHWNDLLHGGKTVECGREVGRADKLFLVLQIILQKQPSLRIEVCPFLGHQLQIVVRGSEAVLDLGTSGNG